MAKLLPSRSEIIMARKDSTALDMVNIEISRKSILLNFKKDYRTFRKNAEGIGVNLERAVLDEKRHLVSREENTRMFYAELDGHEGRKAFTIRFIGIQLDTLWYLGQEITIEEREFVPEKTVEQIEKEVEKRLADKQKKKEKTRREKRREAAKKERENQVIRQRDSTHRAKEYREHVMDSVKMERAEDKQIRTDSLQKAKAEREQHKLTAAEERKAKQDSIKNAREAFKQHRKDSIQRIKEERLRLKEEKKQKSNPSDKQGYYRKHLYDLALLYYREEERPCSN